MGEAEATTMAAENPRRGKGPPSDDGQEVETESTRRQGDRMLEISFVVWRLVRL